MERGIPGRPVANAIGKMTHPSWDNSSCALLVKHAPTSRLILPSSVLEKQASLLILWDESISQVQSYSANHRMLDTFGSENKRIQVINSCSCNAAT